MQSVDYPAAGGRAMKRTRKPYWGTARPSPWAPIWPSGTGGVLAVTGGGASAGALPDVETNWVCSGAGPAQPCGTDSGPTRPPLPMLAVTELTSVALPNGFSSAPAAGPAAAPIALSTAPGAPAS